MKRLISILVTITLLSTMFLIPTSVRAAQKTQTITLKYESNKWSSSSVAYYTEDGGETYQKAGVNDAKIRFTTYSNDESKTKTDTDIFMYDVSEITTEADEEAGTAASTKKCYSVLKFAGLDDYSDKEIVAANLRLTTARNKSTATPNITVSEISNTWETGTTETDMPALINAKTPIVTQEAAFGVRNYQVTDLSRTAANGFAAWQNNFDVTSALENVADDGSVCFLLESDGNDMKFVAERITNQVLLGGYYDADGNLVEGYEDYTYSDNSQLYPELTITYAEPESTDLVASSDVQFRKDNTENVATKATMQVSSGTKNDVATDFVGALKFSGIDTTRKITSAKLVLTTHTKMSGDIEVYPFTNDWNDTNVYADVEGETNTYISSARDLDAVATFTPNAGTGNKIFEKTAEGTSLSAWVNEIDITSAFANNSNDEVSFLLSNTNVGTTSDGSTFFTRDASEATYGNTTITNSADETVTRWSQIQAILTASGADVSDLYPTLKIVYGDYQDIATLRSIAKAELAAYLVDANFGSNAEAAATARTSGAAAIDAAADYDAVQAALANAKAALDALFYKEETIQPTLSLSCPKSVNAGETFEVTLSIDECDEFTGLETEIAYDTEKLKCESLEWESSFAPGFFESYNLTYSENSIKLALAGGKSITASGNICTLSFKALSTADGETEITIADSMIGTGQDAVKVEHKTSNATIHFNYVLSDDTFDFSILGASIRLTNGTPG
ncbi:MAG: hypothetical protein ACI4CT_00845, partial [Lachnospiraceae bacterium]